MNRKTLLSLVAITLNVIASLPLYAQNMSIRLTTSSPVNTHLSFTVNSSAQQLSIDWGDGKLSTYELPESGMATLDGTTKGHTIILNGDDNWFFLDCGNCQLTDIDLSQAGNLQSLHCPNNQLDSLALTGMHHLLDLNCANNNLTKLIFTNSSAPQQDLSKIENLDLSHNKFEGTLVCNLPTLQHLNISGNNFTSLDLGNMPLISLNCNDNQIGGILNIEQNRQLATLLCDNNLFTSLQANTQRKGLRQVTLNNNRLTSLDLSKDEELQDLACNDNRLNKLRLSPTAHLATLGIANNALTLNALPGKESKPLYTAFESQHPFSFTINDGIAVHEDQMYIPVISTWNENAENTIDLSAYCSLADGTHDAHFEWYSIDNTGNTKKMERRSTVSSEGDYYSKGNKCGFFISKPYAYVKISSPTYGVSVESLPIPLGNALTGIQESQASSENLQIYVSNTGILINSPAERFVNIYNIEGKSIFAQKLRGTVSIPLAKGVYFVNSKKIIIA